MSAKSFLGSVAIFCATVLLVMLFFVVGARAATKYDGGGGGASLPACNYKTWNFTVLNLYNHDWFCAPGADHWMIIR